MADVFDIQDDIVSSIVRALAPALLGTSTNMVQRPTGNPDAYELYLRGRHYWHQRSPGTLHTAIQCFEQAIALDPELALAYAGLADCHALLRVYGWVPIAASGPPAFEAVTRAVALNPGLAEVQYSLGFFTFSFSPAWRRAEVNFTNAITISPRWPLARVYHGLFLAARYRFDEAAAEVDQARELDPLSPFVHAVASLTLYVAGKFDLAERAGRRSLELQPDYLLGLWVLGLALYGLERYGEGIAELERAVSLSRAPIFLGVLGLGYALASRDDDARQLLHELEERRRRGEYITPLTQLSVSLGLREVVGIRTALAACVADQTPVQPLRTVCGPFLDQFRNDREIDRLLTLMYDGARPD
jgi:serine/threonine-protein kinase